MKKCPYCGQCLEDDIFHCPKCFAGIPHEDELKQEPVKAEEPKQSSRRKRS